MLKCLIFNIYHISFISVLLGGGGTVVVAGMVSKRLSMILFDASGWICWTFDGLASAYFDVLGDHVSIFVLILLELEIVDFVAALGIIADPFKSSLNSCSM